MLGTWQIPITMAFVDFVSVELISPILRRSEQTEQYVPCLSAEKKYERVLSSFSALSKSDNAYHDAPASTFGDSRSLPSAAPYALVVSVSRRKCYGVTSGNHAVCKLRSARLFLRYAYRSGTISAPLLLACVSRQGEVKHQSADI